MKKRYIICVILTIIILLVIVIIRLNLQHKYNNENSSEVIDSMKVIINEIEYNVQLENNETVENFIKLLPKEVNMSELNGNEKYVYLDESLVANPINPKHISSGDIMLFGNNCLVIFYKSFDTSYSYTKIGHIDNLPDLGNKDVIVKIEK